MKTFSLFIPGKPLTKGSWRPVKSKTTGKTFMKSDNKNAPFWQYTISMLVKKEMNGVVWEGPVRLVIEYYLLKPKSVKRKYPTVKPDADKLERLVLDALTNVAYRDDAQVVDVHHRKFYGNPEGILIQGEEIYEQ